MSVLASAEDVRPIRTQQVHQTEQGSPVIHTRRVDDLVPVVFELVWQNATPATSKVIDLHLENNATGEFEYTPPGGSSATYIYDEPKVQTTHKSATACSVRLRIRQAMAQDT